MAFVPAGSAATTSTCISVPETAPAIVVIPALDTGCVTPDPSTFSAVMDAIPWTVITSAEAVPAVPSAGCLAAVAAPVGNALVSTSTCISVPDTAPAMVVIPALVTATEALLAAMFTSTWEEALIAAASSVRPALSTVSEPPPSPIWSRPARSNHAFTRSPSAETSVGAAALAKPPILTGSPASAASWATSPETDAPSLAPLSQSSMTLREVAAFPVFVFVVPMRVSMPSR